MMCVIINDAQNSWFTAAVCALIISSSFTLASAGARPDYSYSSKTPPVHYLAHAAPLSLLPPMDLCTKATSDTRIQP